MNANQLFQRLVILVLSGATLAAMAAPRAPLEDFAQDPDVSQMRLSPDGQYEAFMHVYMGHPTLCCEAVGSANAVQFAMGMAHAYDRMVPRTVRDYAWISNDRLMLTTTVWGRWYGTLAASRENKMVQGTSGWETLPETRGRLYNINRHDYLWATQRIFSFQDENRNVLMLDLHDGEGEGRLYPDVVKINTLTGSFRTVVKNPGDVVAWGVDHDGRVRIGITRQVGSKPAAIYRENEDAPWKKLELPDNMRELRPLGFDRDGQHLFVTATSPERRVALARLDLRDTARGEVVFSDPEYDVIPEGGASSFDGIRLVRPVFSEKKNALVGIWYLRDGPRVQWFDKEFAVFQQAIDRVMPNTVNLFVDGSRDEKRILFLCYSDRDPGTYCLLDVDKRSIRPVGKRIPQIRPDDMARMYPIQYHARDGLLIHGYLTVPVGYQTKHLPLVVLPHGGPRVRDVWGFDPLVQFLANRGYAVLQMNYRGSPGYGQEFYNKGRQKVGAEIQNDIEDATRWAVAKGVADPEHIAIVGESYGGYSAMFALGHNPGLYKCGVSIAGVTDWLDLFHNLDEDMYKFARETWKENIGDPVTDEAVLKSISPVNFADKITAPLLLIQGEADLTVPPDQAKAMIKAMEKAGQKPESLFLADEGHSLASAAARRESFRTIELFLEKHLGAGLPPRNAE